MGTGEYMAPEQALDTHRADARKQTMSEVIVELEALQGAGRSSAGEEEAASGAAFAFLREYTAGMATRQKVSARVEHTFDHSPHPETGTNLGLRLAGALRSRIGLWIDIGLAAAAGVVVCGVIIAMVS